MFLADLEEALPLLATKLQNLRYDGNDVDQRGGQVGGRLGHSPANARLTQ